MTGARSVGAVVLAGGRSQRFGRDKLTEEFEGRSLLHHAIASVQELTDEVVMVAPIGGEPPVPDGVRVVNDDRPFEGPLVGLVVGLGALKTDQVLVIGGDMPGLQPAVAEALLEEVRSGGAACVLEHAGRARPLPLAVGREVALRTAAELVDGGERRLRALTDALEAVVIPESVWLALDPQARSVLDIDTPADLPSPASD